MSNRNKSRGGRPSKFPPEFRRDAVAMVLDDSRSIADVSARRAATAFPPVVHPAEVRVTIGRKSR